MDRSGLQRLLPVILVLIVAAVAIASMISLGRAIFSNNGEPTASRVNTGKESLVNTTAEHSVKMTVRGPIVAQENFHSYTITVTPDMRNMTTYKGYLSEKVDEEQLENNVQAYTQFVYALNRAKMMDGAPLSGEDNDTRGVCANGKVYEFEVLNQKKTVQKLWTSTCKGSPGSLKASFSQLSRLFRLQIPNFGKLSDKVDLN